MRPLLFTVLTVGCVPEKDDVTETNISGSHVDSSTLVNENCHDYEGSPVAGAAVYFAGTFSVDSSGVQGVEHVFFIANDTWIETGDVDGDCQIALNVSGNFTEPGGCPVCDTALQVSATLIEGQSTCPAGLQVDYQSYVETYDIQQLSDGTANWFFHGSGSQFASGSHTESSLEYLSEAQCQWY